MELFLENNDQIIQREQLLNHSLRMMITLFSLNNYEIIFRK